MDEIVELPAIELGVGDRPGDAPLEALAAGARWHPIQHGILALDAEYRRRAEANELKRIAPRRNNPTGEAWLPLMEKTLPHGRATVLYSNTDRAHQLGRVKDWVVVYFRPVGSDREQRWTVVTEFRGALAGKRVVRGKEGECLLHYQGGDDE